MSLQISETRLRLYNAANIFEVFRTMSHCLHDDEIFRRRYWNTERAKPLYLRSSRGLMLKWQTTLINVDGHTCHIMLEQEHR